MQRPLALANIIRRTIHYYTYIYSLVSIVITYSSRDRRPFPWTRRTSVCAWCVYTYIYAPRQYHQYRNLHYCITQTILLLASSSFFILLYPSLPSIISHSVVSLKIRVSLNTVVVVVVVLCSSPSKSIHHRCYCCQQTNYIYILLIYTCYYYIISREGTTCHRRCRTFQAR